MLKLLQKKSSQEVKDNRNSQGKEIKEKVSTRETPSHPIKSWRQENKREEISAIPSDEESSRNVPLKDWTKEHLDPYFSTQRMGRDSKDLSSRAFSNVKSRILESLTVKQFKEPFDHSSEKLLGLLLPQRTLTQKSNPFVEWTQSDVKAWAMNHKRGVIHCNTFTLSNFIGSELSTMTEEKMETRFQNQDSSSSKRSRTS